MKSLEIFTTLGGSGAYVLLPLLFAHQPARFHFSQPLLKDCALTENAFCRWLTVGILDAPLPALGVPVTAVLTAAS